jgi:hypothetical protein
MPEDTAVATVEQLFGASRRYEADLQWRIAATFALWLCTCYSDDDKAPTWLVHDFADGTGVAWCRVPNRVKPLDLVDAQDTAGDHTSPAEVLLWLEGRAADPWNGDSSGDAILLKAIREKLLNE